MLLWLIQENSRIQGNENSQETNMLQITHIWLVFCSISTVSATVFEESARVSANARSYMMYHLSIMNKLSEKLQGNRAIYIYTYQFSLCRLDKNLHKNVILTS